jgi:hypothetical protein
MSKTLWVGVGCLVVFVASLGMCLHLASIPQVMSATDGPPPTITWTSLWGMIASGAFVPMVLAFWKEHQSQIDSATTAIQGVVTTVTGNAKSSTAIEAVSSALAYAANKTDANAKARFVNAQLAEIRDIMGNDSAIANPLNALVIAITNAQFPVDPLKISVLK